MYPPRQNKKTATNGAASSAGMEVKNIAPTNAPTAPGTAIQPILDQSTLPKRQCETPLAAVVPTSAMCTLADAMAGVSPTASKSVVEVTP